MTGYESTPLRGGQPSGSPSGYSTKEQITSLLRGTDPAAVAASGQGYLDFADSYEGVMTNLRGFADDLARAWKGPASNAAQGQLRDLFIAAYEIRTCSHQAGSAIQEHGAGYLAWYQQSMPTPKTLDEARQWMRGANERISQTWTAIPPEISTGLPDVHHTEYGSPSPSSSSGGSEGRGGAAVTGGGGSVGGSQIHVPGPGEPHRSGGSPDNAGTHLAGVNPTGPGGSLNPAGTVGSAGVLAPGPTEGPGGFGGPGVLVPPSVVPGDGFGGGRGLGVGAGGEEGLIGGGPASALEESAAAEQAASGMAGRPGVMGPMQPGHGGHGGGGGERTSRTWLSEDPAFWSGDLHAAPGIIGAPPTVESELNAEAGRVAADDESDDTAALVRKSQRRAEDLEAERSSMYSAEQALPLDWSE